MERIETIHKPRNSYLALIWGAPEIIMTNNSSNGFDGVLLELEQEVKLRLISFLCVFFASQKKII